MATWDITRGPSRLARSLPPSMIITHSSLIHSRTRPLQTFASTIDGHSLVPGCALPHLSRQVGLRDQQPNLHLLLSSHQCEDLLALCLAQSKV